MSRTKKKHLSGGLQQQFVFPMTRLHQSKWVPIQSKKLWIFPFPRLKKSYG